MSYILRVGLIICSLPLLFVLAGLIGAVIPSSKSEQNRSSAVTLGLLAGPIHNDFVLPLLPEVRRHFSWLGEDIPIDQPKARWLVVGWGARDFYTQTKRYQDVSLRSVIWAVTGDSSVMRVSLVGDIGATEGVTWISLSEQQFERLLQEITNSFNDGAETDPLDVAGFGEFDRFYPAVGAFNIFRTCNVWIGDTLRNSGVRFGVWTPIPQSVLVSYWLYAR